MGQKTAVLQNGDLVVMNGKYKVGELYQGRIFKVVSDVQDICGTDCVFLEGYRGAYAADGLWKIQQQADEPIGKVQTGFCLRQYVGNGKMEDGKEFEIAVAMKNYAPLVVYGKRFFVIDWQDVVKLAEQAGLFADEQ